MGTVAPPAPTRSDPDAAGAGAFLARLFGPERAFDVRLWDGTLLPARGESTFTLALRDRGSLRRMFRIPLALSLGEAYARGDFEIEGDAWAAAPGIEAYRQALRSWRDVAALVRLWRALPSSDAAGEEVHGAHIPGAEGSRKHDLRGIRYHYDAGNELYRLFLDRRMVYSCAYFPRGTEELDAAQELKLEHICRKLRLEPGERLLDVGCGWGGLVIHAAERFGVRALGVTLSREQHDLASRRVAEAGLRDRVEIRIQDYRDLGGEQFDKVASVGMFEHVGRPRLAQYFGHVHALLKPGGLFLNHGIGGHEGPAPTLRRSLTRAITRRLVGSDEFRRRYIFPSGGGA